MGQTVAVVMPAWRAENTIAQTVRSLLAQTYPHWELWLIADDGGDYRSVLAAVNISDTRLRFLQSGGIGLGASQARNVALERISAPYAAVLDADDRFKPTKLERAVEALAEHAIVSCALEVVSQEGRHLRNVGVSANSPLTPGTHKWRNLSMDSMIVWDRRRTDSRYDPSLSNMTDLDFLLRLYRLSPTSMHLGAPLHDYVKHAGSMSESADVTTRMIRSKRQNPLPPPKRLLWTGRRRRGGCRAVPGSLDASRGDIRSCKGRTASAAV